MTELHIHEMTLLDAIHPAIIEKLKRERLEREFEEARRLPLYLPLPPPPKREIEKENEVNYEINYWGA